MEGERERERNREREKERKGEGKTNLAGVDARMLSLFRIRNLYPVTMFATFYFVTQRLFTQQGHQH